MRLCSGPRGKPGQDGDNEEGAPAETDGFGVSPGCKCPGPPRGGPTGTVTVGFGALARGGCSMGAEAGQLLRPQFGRRALESWILSVPPKSLEGHRETEAQRWGTVCPGHGHLGLFPATLAPCLTELPSLPSSSVVKITNTLPVPSGKGEALPIPPPALPAPVAFGDAWRAILACQVGLGSRRTMRDSLGIVLCARSGLMFPAQ